MEESNGLTRTGNNIEEDQEICASDDKRRQDFEDFDVEEFLARSNPLRRLRKRALFSAPEFVQRLKPFEEAKAGSTVVFECKWKGCPKPSVKWYKDDEEITENPRYNVTEDNDGLLKLTIDGACKDDEGAYKVKAENSEGVSSSTGYLSVTGDVSDRPLAAQPRKNLDHSVSFPPHLRTIVEQKSLEEREAEELSNLPPSPIQGYIDSFRRGQTGPLFPGCTEPDYGDDEGESMEQDDDEGNGSDSDTSVESQTFEEELFITEEDDEVPGSEASDPLLPRRQKPLEISLDYSRIVEPLEEDEKPNEPEFIGSQRENESSFSTTDDNEISVPGEIVMNGNGDNLELASEESADHKLAEDFEEFMKSKRKNVEDTVSQDVRDDYPENQLISLSSENLPPETAAAQTVISEAEIYASEKSSELPDIIQTVAEVNKDKEHLDLDTGVKEITEPTKDNEQNQETERVPTFKTEIENVVNINTSIPKTNLSSDTVSVVQKPVFPKAESVADNCDLPWLLYLGLASVSSSLASYTNMSPLYYVLIWVAISFLSFQVFVKEERAEHAT